MTPIFSAIIAFVVTMVIYLFESVIDAKRATIVGGKDPVHTISELVDVMNGKYPGSDYKRLVKAALEVHDMNPPMTLDDIKIRLKYSTCCKFPRTTTHNGQIKLGASEIRFLTIETSPDAKADSRMSGDFATLCVYAGAAPSNKHGILCKMFPRVKFLFVDPNPFSFHGVDPDAWTVIHDPEGVSKHAAGYALSENALTADGVYDGKSLLAQALALSQQTVIINDLFTNDLADAIGEMFPSVLFISDIRTNHHNEGHNVPDAVDILWNYAQQFNWVRKMKSRANMTKFRHPFYTESDEIVERGFAMPHIRADMDLAKTTIGGINGIDFRGNYRDGRRLVWFDGVVDLQVFAPMSSTESRLRFTGKKTRDWGHALAYDDAFFAHNNTTRPFARCKNPNADREIGFDLCSDCAGLNRILTDYHEKFSKKVIEISDGKLDPGALKREVVKCVKHFMTLTDRSLFRDNHGYLFEDGVDISRMYDASLRYFASHGKHATLDVYRNKKLDDVLT